MSIIINDNVWGNIEIEDNFWELMKLPEFQRLKKINKFCINKNQNFNGGKYTIYDHYIGTYHLMRLLVNSFRKYICINTKEENVLKLLALLHDIGRPYSHVFEPIMGISHEQSTIDILVSIKNKIDKIFYKGITDEVIQLIVNKEKKELFNNKILFIDFIFGIFSVNHIDNIARDSLSIRGKKIDFSTLFYHIDIDIVNDFPKIVFKEEAVPLLENYLITHFRNYKQIYFDSFTMVMEELFRRMILILYPYQSDINLDLSEIEIENKLKNVLCKNMDYNNYYNYYIFRLATIVYNTSFENLLIKKFNNKEEASLLEAEIKGYINLDYSFYGKIYKKVNIYEPKISDLLIKTTNNEIKDFSEVSAIIKGKIEENVIVSYLDIDLLKLYLNLKGKNSKEISNIISNIKNLYNNKKYEIEKKYLFNNLDSLNVAKEMFNFKNRYKLVLNKDIYFETGAPDEQITARKRLVNGDVIYTIKSITDKKSLTKRKENNYHKLNDERFLNILNKILLQNDLNPISDLKPKMKIITTREKNFYKFKKSKIEIAFDRVIYESIDGKKITDYMLEIELKSGNPLSLYLLHLKLMSINGIKICKKSKLVRATNFLINN